MASTVSLQLFGFSCLLTVKQVDWEHPSNPEQGRDFLALLAAVRLHLPDDRYLLTAALPAGQWALQNIDLYKAQDYLDLLNIMAYDFTGSWSQKVGHHAQLFPGNPGEASGSAAVEYVISTGFPAAKVLLGVPVYGRSFLGATGPGQSYNGHGGEEGTFEYKQLPRQSTEEIVNTRVVAAFCTGGDGGFVTYDNPETVKMKANYCIEKGLGVYALFRLLKTGKTNITGFILLDRYSRHTSWPSKFNISRV
jgi:chitinase